MRHKIPQSIANAHGDFAGKVIEYGAELKLWSEHMERVARDEKNPNLVPAARHVAYPRPTADRDIELSVDENFQPNFEILDDGLTAEQKLAIKKNTLSNIVTAHENAALEAIVPSLKRRYFAIREAEIIRLDQSAQQAFLIENGPATTPQQLEDATLKSRSDEDARFMEEQAERNSKMDKIIRAAAKAHHDIEDLTAENIDAWKPVSFI